MPRRGQLQAHAAQLRDGVPGTIEESTHIVQRRLQRAEDPAAELLGLDRSRPVGEADQHRAERQQHDQHHAGAVTRHEGVDPRLPPGGYHEVPAVNS